MDHKGSAGNAGEGMEGRFVFRAVSPGETEEAAAVEAVCFPPNEACTLASMRKRIAKAQDLFLVAVDRRTGRIAGFLNGLATNEEVFRDEFFTDAELHDPAGKNIMLLGLDVLPEYRGQGLAKELVRRYREREKARGIGRERLFLTCKQAKVPMYEHMGFTDHGISGSVWGGEAWHDMTCPVG